MNISFMYKIISNSIIKKNILKILADVKIATSPEIAERIGISVQKSNALLRQLLVEGSINRERVSVCGKGALWGYSLAKMV